MGLRSDYNFLANTIKSYVSLRLQPAEDKYYLIEVVNDLSNDLEAIIDLEKDSLRFYYLGNNWKNRVEHIGAKEVIDVEGTIIL